MTSKPYKVVQLSSVHFAFDTRVFHKISKSLAKSGYEVDLIIQHSKDEMIDGVNIVSLPVATKKSDRITKVLPRLFNKCIQYPNKTIFHLHDPELIPLGLVLKIFGYKVIYDAHENTPEDFLTKEWFNPKISKLLSNGISFIEKIADKYLDAIVTTTSPISQRYENSNLSEIRNYPILDDKYKRSVKSKVSKKDQVIYIGDITYRRGIREMITAMDMLNGDVDAKLVLGGKFSPENVLCEVKKIQGWHKCDFVGWLSLDQVWKNLAESKVGLVTIQPYKSHFTQLPVKLFEYMAAGIPVVCSDFPMYRQIVDSCNCGLLVDPTSPQEIAEAITTLLKNPDKAQEMGKNGKKAIMDELNWESEANKLLNLYTSLTKN